MKRFTHLKPILFWALSMTLLLSCSQEEELTDKNPHSAFLALTVTDTGYTSPDGSLTKATEDNYVTTFTVGDKIGLFAVKDAQIQSGVNNLQLTAKDNGSGGLIWKTSTDGNVPCIEGATYYAYYPYQASLVGTLTPSATTSALFFDDVISSWPISDDQSTYAKYTANDLMTAKASPSGYTLSLGMTHHMALSVIKTPAKVYTFTNASPAIPAYTVPYTNEFSNQKPYPFKGNEFRYLHKPSSTAKLLGIYVKGTGTKVEWEVPLNSTAGGYKSYTVDASESSSSSHLLQAGDFLLADGTILPKTATLTSTQLDNCIGIVLKPGFDSSLDDDIYKTKEGSTAISSSNIHGYVVARRSYDGAKTWATPSYQTTVIGTSNNTSDFRGYGNSQKLKAYAAQLGYGPDLQTIFPAVNYATYAFEVFFEVAPTFTSGWFLPSIGQLEYLYQNRTTLLTSLQKLDSSFSWRPYYWSSTESGANAYYFNFSVGQKYANNKSDTNWPLPMLVF